MASATNSTTNASVDPKSDICTVAQDWEKWLKRFKRHLAAMNMSNGKSKTTSHVAVFTMARMTILRQHVKDLPNTSVRQRT